LRQTIPGYCRALVESIERERGRSLTPSVRKAFLQVPRHVFVQHYYEHKQIKLAPPLSDESAWEAWLSTIYQDQALTTQIDERGLPTSSSSQPGAMALMLEQLQVEPGMRILEVGTGTGYNAALLAKLAGDPHGVTTVDIDPTLIEMARPCIEDIVGSGMTICTWNGIDGYVPNAPYDRIIATGSFLPVPAAWMEQLLPGGKMILDMRGNLSGGLVTLSKHAGGTATGQFLPEGRSLSFMRLRSSLEAGTTLPLLKGYQQLPVREATHLLSDDPVYNCALHFQAYEQFHGQDDEVNFWLQWLFPEVGIKWKGSPPAMHGVLTDYATETVATLAKQEDGITITVHGARPLWSEILQAYQAWQQAGKPGREHFTLHIDQRGQQEIGVEYHGAVCSTGIVSNRYVLKNTNRA
jgi:protein-L-isoaspartate O-methyltransferase